MSDIDPNELERIFNLAFDAPPAERAALLDRECAGNSALRMKIETLLSGADDSRFLNPPTSTDLPTVASGLVEQPGACIGPYKLLQNIGEGGFGTVFMAEQQHPVTRRVALKIIKLGMDTRQVVARFEQERQALALMDHPNIARVYDAGSTDTGRPYFVMELCAGDPITEYCDTHKLPISQRLELFTQVCRAVQHAHQKGLIHRDIKPSNVLVSTQDGKPHAKIIDFGIAKATASKLTEKTLFTEHRQLIGTPQYMSPEQAEGSLDIDTRSDVYSLGVLLYELLTGATPFDGKTLRGAAYAEIQRIIREVDPPRPSTRLNQSSDTIAGIAARRNVEPRKLGTLVRGELDWIAMKALEKDRGRRYESANALGADVERYLAGDAIVAAPPSRVYRARKFLRRNKGPATAAAAVGLALLLGMVAFAWQASRAEIERDKAQRAADFMSETLRGVGPSVARGRDTTLLRDIMDIAAARIERGELAKSPAVELKLRDTIGDVYRELALFTESEKLLAPAVERAREISGTDHPDVAQALFTLASLDLGRGNFPAAEKGLRESLAIRRREFPADSVPVADSLNELASALNNQGQTDEAEALYREALGIWRRIAGGDHRDLSIVLNNLAQLLIAKGRFADADPLMNEAVAMHRRLFPGDHPQTADMINNQGSLAQLRGDLNGAERLFNESLEMRRRLYPPENVNLAVALSCLATIHFSRGEFARAEQMHVEAVAIYRKTFPGDHPQLANGMANLALAISGGGDWKRAEAMMNESIAMRKRLTPGGNTDIAAMLINLSAVRRALKDYPGAQAAARESLEMSRRLFPGDHVRTAEAIYLVALAVGDGGDPAAAEPLFRESAEMWRRLFEGDHIKLAVTLSDWADVMVKTGDPATAEKLAREAANMLDRLHGDRHWTAGSARLRLGQALIALDRFPEAEVELLSAERILSTNQGAPKSRIEECRAALDTTRKPKPSQHRANQ